MTVKLTIIETTAIIFSTIEVAILTYGFVWILRKGIKTERSFQLMFVILALAMLAKAVYSYTCAFSRIDDAPDTADSQRYKFTLWYLQMKSLGLMHVAFSILLAKIFALLIAFSRRRLTKSIESLQKSNNLIFCVGLVVFGIVLVNDVIVLVIYFCIGSETK